MAHKLKIHREECDDIPVDRPERQLCEVAHYQIEYGAPGSLADFSYELGKSARTERCIVGAINRGMAVAKRNLPRLIDKGLVKITPYGGYVLTGRGRLEFKKIAKQYGIKLHRSEVV